MNLSKPSKGKNLPLRNKLCFEVTVHGYQYPVHGLKKSMGCVTFDAFSFLRCFCEFTLVETKTLAKKIRIHALYMTSRGGSSHIGAALSIADILAVLYNGILDVDPKIIETEKVLNGLIRALRNG